MEIRQFRVVVRASDFDRTCRFYGEVLALPRVQNWDRDDSRGALVEPGGNAWRALEAAAVGPGERMLVLGAGAIGLLVALMARAAGVDVHLLTRREPSVRFAASLPLSGRHHSI